jgi:hypothetical protein
MRGRTPVADFVVPQTHKCGCGSTEIIATYAGTIAEADMPLSNIIPMHPAPEIPRVDYCAACWPWSKAAAPLAAAPLAAATVQS